jgi:hypothetical protein
MDDSGEACPGRLQAGGRNPVLVTFWTPAFAGVTVFGDIENLCNQEIPYSVTPGFAGRFLEFDISRSMSF